MLGGLRGWPEPRLGGGNTGVLPLVGGSTVTQVTTALGEDLCVTRCSWSTWGSHITSRRKSVNCERVSIISTCFHLSVISAHELSP